MGKGEIPWADFMNLYKQGKRFLNFLDGVEVNCISADYNLFLSFWPQCTSCQVALSSWHDCRAGRLQFGVGLEF